jgi:hypothetical protein
MLEFSYYLQTGQVKRKSRDKNLARSLLRSAEERIAFSKTLVESKPRFAMELAYEAVRELADAIMSADGYKTFSHEVAISFLSTIEGLSKASVERLDVSRRKRNASKYYGADVRKDDAESELKFLSEMFGSLKVVLKKKIG